MGTDFQTALGGAVVAGAAVVVGVVVVDEVVEVVCFAVVATVESVQDVTPQVMTRTERP
jgi:hypothetical protein